VKVNNKKRKTADVELNQACNSKMDGDSKFCK